MSPRRRAGAYVGRRVLLCLPTLLLVAAFVFGLIRLLPGDPAQTMLGDSADPTTLAGHAPSLGLDQSLPVQFLTWAGHAVTGDLGRSIATASPVVALVLDRFRGHGHYLLSAVLLATALAVIGGFCWPPRTRIGRWMAHRRPGEPGRGDAELLARADVLLIFGVTSALVAGGGLLALEPGFWRGPPTWSFRDDLGLVESGTLIMNPARHAL